MARDEYIRQLNAQLHRWRSQLGAGGIDPTVEFKFRKVIAVMTDYQRMGAGAWSEQERALDVACRDLQNSLGESHADSSAAA